MRFEHAKVFLRPRFDDGTCRLLDGLLNYFSHSLILQLNAGHIIHRTQNGKCGTLTALKLGYNWFMRVLPAVEEEIGHEADIELRQSKYLNNVVEQDHRTIERIVRPMVAFKTFRCAGSLIAAAETMQLDYNEGR